MMTDYEILQAIDQQPITCTDWEVAFLESCLSRGPEYRLSPKQSNVVKRMADEYLAESVVAEWLGQITMDREGRW